MSARKDPAVVITGVGMRSSIGQNVIQSAAATRAGICRFSDWPPVAGPRAQETGAELVAAAVTPDLGDRDWIEKLDDLATQPLMEALWMAGFDDVGDDEGGGPTRWALHLSTPSLDRPGVDPDNAASFAEDVRERTLLGLEIPEVQVVSTGNTGVFASITGAITSLIQGRAQMCVVGGVDSLLHTPHLAALDDDGRLKTEATPVGLTPGEGAAFVVLERAEQARSRQARALARVTPPRLAVERQSPDGKAPGRGKAASQVLRQALADAPCPPDRIHRVLTDLNGERWRFLEWAIASNPALAGMPPDWRLWHPADCFGDVGAATGAMHLCLATRAFERHYAVGDAIIIFNASDTGERGALCVYPGS